ncbi:hypothetical protein FGSG_12362 [Fusarium graminearum PH-1]|uniref:hypothetical protein n=1 Tax=Gibberella zeae (strain ATCC MYA-4620 / CBS 123657 / FGSC 9075 / NRRL 31084 / PH-1) TaxID=229533 RepID=UPI00021F2397|nr:hypothetical protein FGSG_12362 [Fusarium graminearum PH-1]ESU09308.1 hypothetical protein FGSG_12362 [Fusarium graminearum PH-1]|eukprot:XP_011321807.1 hypothetical protein FGSG_12362 [Fusarium graminearum PH-1]
MREVYELMRRGECESQTTIDNHNTPTPQHHNNILFLQLQLLNYTWAAIIMVKIHFEALLTVFLHLHCRGRLQYHGRFFPNLSANRHVYLTGLKGHQIHPVLYPQYPITHLPYQHFATMAQILETLAPEAEEPLFPIDETTELIWPTMFSGQAILWTCQLTCILPVLGLVAVLPIGMAQVSSVKMTTQVGDKVKKGDEIFYFQFGGSDVICVFQPKADLKVDHFVASPDGTYSRYGTVLARAPKK